MSLFDTLDNKRASQSGIAAGVTIGKVIENSGDPENIGRIKISLPVRAGAAETFWARVATIMAGNNRGAYFLPEKEDEVLVAFEDGDVEHPVVIGSLWNGQDAAPETNGDGKNNVRVIKSRSGHTLTFNDDADNHQEQVILKSNAGHAITLDDTQGSEKLSIIDKSGANKVVFDSAQNCITIESSMQLNIKANIIQIEGTSSVTIKSSGMLTIQGTPVMIN
jgi:uncharacterized protein involved in type VI secretion and phage assembly